MLQQHRVGVVDVRVDAVPAGQAGQLLEAAGIAANRHVVHLSGGPGADPHDDRLIVGPERAIDDELIRLGVSGKRAREMGHLPQSGPGGMLEVLKRLPRSRKILIHINNTNPILDEESPERAELCGAGIEVAYDGMEIQL